MTGEGSSSQPGGVESEQAIAQSAKPSKGDFFVSKRNGAIVYVGQVTESGKYRIFGEDTAGVKTLSELYEIFRPATEEDIASSGWASKTWKSMRENPSEWGLEGEGHSNGYGLAKLAKYHPEVLFNLQEILDDMVVTKRSENRAQLESDKYQAAARLTWDKEAKTWLLTMFEKKNSALDNTTDTDKTLSGNGNDTATPENTVVPSDNNRHTTVNQPTETDEASQGTELSGTTEPSRMNAPISEGKGSASLPKEQISSSQSSEAAQPMTGDGSSSQLGEVESEQAIAQSAKPSKGDFFVSKRNGAIVYVGQITETGKYRLFGEDTAGIKTLSELYEMFRPATEEDIATSDWAAKTWKSMRENPSEWGLEEKGKSVQSAVEAASAEANQVERQVLGEKGAGALDTADIRKTILHELVGHHGLRRMVGEDNFNNFLSEVFKHADAELRAKITDLAKRRGWDYQLATEEFIAGLAERGFDDMTEQERSLWQKIKDLVQKMLDKLMGGSEADSRYEVSENDLRYMLWRSYQKLKSEREGTHPAVERAEAEMKRRELVGESDGGDGMRFRDERFSQRVNLDVAYDSAKDSIREMGHKRETDLGKLQSARDAVARYTRKALAASNMPALKKMELNNILSSVKQVRNRGELESHLRKVEAKKMAEEMSYINNNL